MNTASRQRVDTPAGRTSRSPRARAALCAIAATCLASCAADPSRGYSFSSSFDDDVRTVHVEMFDNSTFFHGAEIDLTEAIIKRIQSTTPWVVTSPENADTILSGAITDATLLMTMRGRRSGLVDEQGYQLTIQFEWRDARTSRVLASRSNFRTTETFVPARAAGEPIEVGRRGAADDLARHIVAEMRSNW